MARPPPARGRAVMVAAWAVAMAQETLAMAAATANPSAPLTRNPGLDAATWYGDMSTTIGDTRKVADQAAGQITARANTLKANATKRLLLTSIITLLLLVLLIVTTLARPLRRLARMAHPSDGGRLSGMSTWSGGRKATM